MNNFPELLQSALVFLQNHHAVETLVVLGGLLVLVDYYFPTDWPAHVGYVCIAAAFFFIVNLPAMEACSCPSACGSCWQHCTDSGFAAFWKMPPMLWGQAVLRPAATIDNRSPKTQNCHEGPPPFAAARWFP